MTATSPLLACGPAGWSGPGWDALVYPRPRPSGFHPLELLASIFDVVEIPSPARGAIAPEVARLWIRKVSGNPRFRFSALASPRFTHDRLLEPSALESFSLGLRPILQAGRLGCVLLQFPWSFRFTVENREFFIRLRRALHEFPLAAEMRHESWISAEALGVFIDYHVGFVNIDQPQTIRATPPTALLTSGIGYVRLEGRRWDPGRQSPRRDHLFPMGDLDEWKVRIDRFRAFAEATYVVFANAVAGRSVVNALQMQGLLTGLRHRPPPALARNWRVDLAAADRAIQPPLFPSAADAPADPRGVKAA